jgi:hypothetical protein
MTNIPGVALPTVGVPLETKASSDSRAADEASRFTNLAR